MELSDLLNKVFVFKRLFIIVILSSSVFGTDDTFLGVNLLVNKDSLTWINRHFQSDHSNTVSLEYQDKKWPIVWVRIVCDGSQKKYSLKMGDIK